MGEYWKPVNITKREYIHPHDLNDGLKMGEWTWPKSRTMRMIGERWDANDVVLAVSEYDGVHLISGVYDDVTIPPSYHELDELGFKRISR